MDDLNTALAISASGMRALSAKADKLSHCARDAASMEA
jgi:hypothetical protein